MNITPCRSVTGYTDLNVPGKVIGKDFREISLCQKGVFPRCIIDISASKGSNNTGGESIAGEQNVLISSIDMVYGLDVLPRPTSHITPSDGEKNKNSTDDIAMHVDFNHQTVVESEQPTTRNMNSAGFPSSGTSLLSGEGGGVAPTTNSPSSNVIPPSSSSSSEYRGQQQQQLSQNLDNNTSQQQQPPGSFSNNNKKKKQQQQTFEAEDDSGDEGIPSSVVAGGGRKGSDAELKKNYKTMMKRMKVMEHQFQQRQQPKREAFLQFSPPTSTQHLSRIKRDHQYQFHRSRSRTMVSRSCHVAREGSGER